MKHLNYLKKVLLPVLVLLASVPALGQALSGTYTVGGTAPNYATPAAAVAALNSNGVSGPVTFNIRPGTYVGQLTIGSNCNGVAGTSATNKVVFQNDPLNVGTVTISFTGSSTTNNWVVRMNSASWITLKGLTLTNTATATYARVVEFFNSASTCGQLASNNTVDGCTLNGCTTTTAWSTTSNLSLVYGNTNSTYNFGNANTIKNNIFNGGSQAVILSGGSATTAYTDGNIIENNTVNNNVYSGPVTSYYCNNTKIRNNTIAKTGAGTYYGIYVQNSNGGLEINGNNMTCSTGASGQKMGFYLYNCLGSMEVRNNSFIANNGVTGVSYGFYLYNCQGTPTSFQGITGNTINISTNSTLYGVASTYCQYDSISNNNFTLTNTTGATQPISSSNSTSLTLMGYYQRFTGNTFACTATSSGGMTLTWTYSNKSSFSGNNLRMQSVGGAINHTIQYADSFDFNNNTIYDSTTTGAITAYNPLYGNSSVTYSYGGGSFNGNNMRYISNSGAVTHYLGYYHQNVPMNNNTVYCRGAGAVNNYLGYYDINGEWKNNNVTSISTGSYSYCYMGYPTSNAVLANNTSYVEAVNSYGYNYFGYATAASNQAPMLVENNTLTTVLKGSSYGYGCFLYDYLYAKTVFRNNKVLMTAENPANYAWGMYCYGPNNSKIYNNTFSLRITGTPSASYQHAAFMNYYDGYAPYEVYNNTFHAHSAATNVHGFYKQSTTTTFPAAGTYSNNIFAQTGGNGMGLYWNGAGSTFLGDYNLYYSPGASFAFVNGSTFGSMATMRSGLGTNRNSLTYNPGFIDPSISDLRPDPANSNSWSVQGRGVQIPGNNTDILGAARSTLTGSGVPDLGAYEFTPTATAPAATAIPATAVAGSPQHFLFGGDTVCTINWATGSTVPPSGGIMVKKYTGIVPPSSFTSFNGTFMYNFDSIGVPAAGTYNYSINNYYKDPWMGTIASEASLHLATKNIVASGPWTGWPLSVSNANTTRNFISTVPTPTGMSSFGYYTAIDVGDNAGVSPVALSPTGSFCPGSYNVTIKVLNNGNNVINNVTLKWQILPSGPVQTIPVTTPIPVNNGTGNNFVPVSLGSLPIPGSGINIKAWTTMPNGVVDPVSSDDTANPIRVHPALAGTYIIDIANGAGTDYTTVVAAVADLNAYGLCGPTTFRIRPGTYSGAVQLSNVIGSNSTNRVTFMSDNGNAGSAIITAGTAYVIQMNSASYYSFKNLSVSATGASTGYAFDFEGISSFDTISGCNVSATVINSSTVSAIYAPSAYAGNGVVIQNNNLSGGYAPMYWNVSNTSGGTKNIVVERNTISNFGTMGMYIYPGYNPKVNYNTITTGGPYGFYFYNYYGNMGGTASVATPFEFQGNRMLGLATTYAMYCYMPNGYSGVTTAAPTRSKFKNNSFVFGSLTYGIYCYYPSLVDFHHNTFYQTTGSSTYGVLFNTGGLAWNTNNEFRNNLFVNYGASSSGNAYIYLYPNQGNTSDYNAFFLKGSGPTHYSYNGAHASFQAYKTSVASYGWDVNSVFGDPGMGDINTPRPDPANPNSWLVNGRGVQLPATGVDINGNTRPTLLANGAPDMGAHEFEPTVIPPACTAVPATATPGGTQTFLFGSDTVARITWNPTLLFTSPLNVRRYSGRIAPTFTSPYPAGVSSTRYMYFHTDIQATNGTTFNFNSDIYYRGIWNGTIQNESQLLLAHKWHGTFPWIVYIGGSSSVNTSQKYIRANGLTSFGTFTGIDTPAIVSAIVYPSGSTIFCYPGGGVTLIANNIPGAIYKWRKVGNPDVDAPGVNNQTTYNVTTGGDYYVEMTVIISGNPTTARSANIAVTTVAPPMALVTPSGALTYCNGTNLSLNTPNQTGLTYQWLLNGTAIANETAAVHIVKSAGVYTLQVKNIGCTTTSKSDTVSAGPITVDLGADILRCEKKNDPYILDAGWPGAKYYWSVDGNNIPDTTQKIAVFKGKGKYKVIVNAGGPGCISDDSVEINIRPLPSLIGISYIKEGNRYIFNAAGVKDVTGYLWIFNDQGNVTTSNLPVPPSMTYQSSMQVCLVLYNDCGSDTTCMVNWATNVSNATKGEFEVSLYPNPATDKATLSVEGDVSITEISVLNTLGEVVYRETVSSVKSHDIDVSRYASGRYLVRAITTSGTITKPLNIIRQ